MNSHLRIQLSGKDLRLPSDASIDIEEKNPLFNDTEMFSYPVSIPLEGNRSVVKNVDDINSDARVNHLEHKPMQIWADGFPFRSGVAVVQEDEEVEDSVSINMDASTQTFSDLIGDLKCNEIPVKDEIVIGEKIGNVQVDATYTFHVKADIKKHKDWHKNYSGNHVSGSFEPQALGFSYPGVCKVSTTGGARYQVAAQKSVRSYPQSNSVVVPKVKTSYINTSAAYGETMANGKPAYYANARVCYKHYALDSDGSTSSSTVERKDSKNIYEDIYPYWVLDADRPQSGICFYVLYFLDCLFAYLGVDFDKSALTAIGDFRRLVFFTTKCKYTTRKADQYNQPGRFHHFKNVDEINAWLSSRGCGGQIEIEKPETKTVDEFTYTDLTVTPNSTTHYKVGDDNCRSIEISASYDSTPTVTADIYEMLASGENFPEESVQTVLDSFCAAFGIKFDYDYEQKKVTAYLLRDVFRQSEDKTDAVPFMGKILQMYPMMEKILGFRMRYSQEQDKKEQLQNIKDAANYKNQDYETDYNYIDYQEGKTEYNKVYRQFFDHLSPTDETCYIDKTTGNAFRIKRDKEATTLNDFHPVLFEVGGYKGVEIGDCSDQNEDYIEDKTISFQPVIMNDVNYYNEQDKLSSTTVVEDKDSRIGDFNTAVSSVMAAFVDKDMEHEFVEQRIRNTIGDYYVSIYATEKLKLVESYDPNSTSDGNSPLQDYDWGCALSVMRGGGSDMDVQTFDYGYDTFGNGKWRTVAGGYAMTPDCIDNFGNDYDYNGKLDGIGNEERISLKIRAFKNPDWAEKKGISLCNSDVIDATTKKVTRKVKSRGLFDSFLSEYAHFVLNRKKFLVKALVSAAQLADISNHWKDRWNIGGKIGYINKVSYKLSAEKGVEDVEIEFFSI